MGSNACPGMNINACPAMSPFRHNSWDQWRVPNVKFMCKPLNSDGLHERISNNDLLATSGGRITGECGFKVGLESLPDGRDFAQEFGRQFMGSSSGIAYDLRTIGETPETLMN